MNGKEIQFFFANEIQKQSKFTHLLTKTISKILRLNFIQAKTNFYVFFLF